MAKRKPAPAKKEKTAKIPIGGRTLREYYNLVALPLVILVAWSVVGYMMNYLTVGLASGMTQTITLSVQLVVGVYIGFLAIEKFSNSRKSDAAIAGGLAGLINGVLIMVFNLVRGENLDALKEPFMGLAVVMVAAFVGALIFKILRK
ncbi:hypothetical protein HY992_00185 [Candidatus Micrarchaeota archaeon]|nr:hypothetical protein [Candidatus Micrarchaeota archaeon]